MCGNRRERDRAKGGGVGWALKEVEDLSPRFMVGFERHKGALRSLDTWEEMEIACCCLVSSMAVKFPRWGRSLQSNPCMANIQDKMHTPLRFLVFSSPSLGL